MSEKVRMHICGNITYLLPPAFPAWNSMPSTSIIWSTYVRRGIFGKKVALGDSLDPVKAVLRLNPEKIRRAILAPYKQVGNLFIVNACRELPRGTPVENLKALRTIGSRSRGSRGCVIP